MHVFVCLCACVYVRVSACVCTPRLCVPVSVQARTQRPGLVDHYPGATIKRVESMLIARYSALRRPLITRNSDKLLISWS